MKPRKIRNFAASVRQRLLNEARASGRPFNEILQYFAMERVPYRLSKSPHGEKFVLKGALMLAAWEVALTRPTRDIDLLANVATDIDRIVEVVQEFCRQEVEPDGMNFDPDSVRGEWIAGRPCTRGCASASGVISVRPGFRCRSTWVSAA